MNKAISELKKKTGIFLFVAVTIMVFVLSFFLLRQIFDVRIFELNTYLISINRQGSGKDYLDLVKKYRLYKELYIGRKSEDNLTIDEIKSASLAENSINTPILQEKISQAALFTINMVRFLMSKKPIIHAEEQFSNEFIEKAYNNERKKAFAKAIFYYQFALEKEEEQVSFIQAIIRLHLGFCLSITGKKTEAKSEYLYVIDNYPDEDIAFTAFLLLNYLERFETEIEKVKQEDSDILTKSEKLYKLIAFEEALALLESEENLDENPEKNIIKYFIARCHEELGETMAALETYQEVIIDDPDSPQAELANKRIYTVGIVYLENEDLVELSVNNNELIEDPGFDELVEQSETYYLEHMETGTVENVEEEDPELEIKIDAFIEKNMAELEKIIPAPDREDDDAAGTASDEKLETDEEPPRNEFVEEYNNEGEKIKSVYYDENSEIEYYMTYAYTENGLVSRVDRCDGQGNLVRYYIYIYDENNAPIEVTSYNREGNVIIDDK